MDIIQDIFLPIVFLLLIRLWLAHDLHDRSIVTYYNVTSYYYLCDCSHIPSTHPLTSSGESVIKFITRFAVMRVNELALKQNGFGHELTNEHTWRPRRRTFQTKRQCQLMERAPYRNKASIDEQNVKFFLGKIIPRTVRISNHSVLTLVLESITIAIFISFVS